MKKLILIVTGFSILFINTSKIVYAQNNDISDLNGIYNEVSIKDKRSKIYEVDESIKTIEDFYILPVEGQRAILYESINKITQHYYYGEHEDLGLDTLQVESDGTIFLAEEQYKSKDRHEYIKVKEFKIKYNLGEKIFELSNKRPELNDYGIFFLVVHEDLLFTVNLIELEDGEGLITFSNNYFKNN
ncbi:hypothetical protein [Facklamia miroungae]|uniref:Uncharacterized protein n=1 Tax=Facklamia miroungae TaxID=120956 RepID=A0A1G7UGB4_9LACT|nr:hypothetical protein [Facklamia miroungae]NKZ30118.1 hypothetical protein [Facklamia miroungae]SDG46533.1 hypothetical protein SAMN05421791_1105 [Facklamia miroungae]